MIFAWMAFFNGILAILLTAAGIALAHFDVTAPIVGFLTFVAGFLLGLLALLFSIVALIVMLFSPRRRIALGRTVFGGILSLIVVMPVLEVLRTHPYPAINDITTDTSSPPEFVPAGDLTPDKVAAMKYDRAKYAAVQQGFYTNLTPLKIEGAPDDTFKKVEIIAGEIPSWRITMNDAGSHTIEGVATSGLFHFRDDFVIQVRPQPGGGALVEMRSKSRDGKGDLGVNYNRIESFFTDRQGSPRGVATPAAS